MTQHLHNHPTLLFQNLVDAIRSHNTNLVSSFINQGAPLKHDHESALLIAAESGTPLTIQLLLNCNANIEDTDSNDFNALMVAAYHGKLQNVEIILENLVSTSNIHIDFGNLHDQDAFGRNAFWIAASRGHPYIMLSIMNTLINIEGGKPSPETLLERVFWTNAEWFLNNNHMNAYMIYIDVLLFNTRKFDVNNVPNHMARFIHDKNLNFARLAYSFFEKNDSFEENDFEDQNAFSFGVNTVDHKVDAIYSILSNHNMFFQNSQPHQNFVMPFHRIIYECMSENHKSILFQRILIKMEVDTMDDFIIRFAHSLIFYTDLEPNKYLAVIMDQELLPESDLIRSIFFKRFITLLMWTFNNGQFLINRYSEAYIPLTEAMKVRVKEIVWVLMNRLASNNDLTAFFDIIQAVNNLEIQNWDHETPLFIAIRNGSSQIVAALLDRGANKYAQNIEQDTAIDIANECGTDAIRSLLSPEMHTFGSIN